MEQKKIPSLFEDAAIYQPLSPISDALPNVGKTRVRLFYKYANRNYSFITDKVAEQIIQSAPAKPVVGFFNREEEDFTTHMGESVVSGYGFVAENPNFAWEKHLDKDGIEREYACFDVILFTEYFPEANKIVGQPQSMELRPESIEGDWGMIDDEFYFIYSSATLKGLCVLGKNVEPCFEGSAFFSLDDNSKFDKFSALLIDLQEKVKETENFLKGGEQKMENTEFEVVTDITEQPENIVEFETAVVEENETAVEVESEAIAEEFAAVESVVEEISEPSELEILQESFEQLKKRCHELEDSIASLTEDRDSFAASNSELKTSLESAEATIANYQRMEAQIEAEKKQNLIAHYEKENMLSAEEIEEIKGSVENFSYEELDSKMAIMFAHNSMKTVTNKVPLINTEESDFASFMQKYKK